MRSDLPLTVYFDGSCRLCRSEILNIQAHDVRAHDTRGYLVLVDCSAPDFDDTPFRAEGITRAAMLERMHVRDRQGHWVQGVDAFELLYRTVRMQRMASLWGGRTRGLMERLYPWIARHRHGLSLTGLPLLFEAWGRCAARKAFRQSQKCGKGQCSI